MIGWSDGEDEVTATWTIDDEAVVDSGWAGWTFSTTSALGLVSRCFSNALSSLCVLSFFALSLFSFVPEIEPLSFFSSFNARRSSLSFFALDPDRILLLAKVPHAELPESTDPPLTFRTWWP
jgi:hypothetical protein